MGCKHSSNPQSGSRNSSSPLSTAEVSLSSSLAAIAFNDIQDLVRYRIYYQDNNGAIKESSWNSSGQSWYVSNAAIGLAKSKSPLAPLVTGPQQHPCVSIYYIFLAAFCANAWVACSISMSMLLVVLVNSFPGHPRTQIGQVAALLLLLALSVKKAFSQRQTRIWLRIGTVHQAAPNVPIHSIFYQQPNGGLQWGNLKDGGLIWSPVQAGSILGSSLATDFRFFNSTRDVMLYYQLPTGYISPLIYNGSSRLHQSKNVEIHADIYKPGMNKRLVTFRNSLRLRQSLPSHTATLPHAEHFWKKL